MNKVYGVKNKNMKREDLPKQIISPITGDTLELEDISLHNDEELSIAQFFDDCTEWVSDCAMYLNESTKESIYVSIERNI